MTSRHRSSIPLQEMSANGTYREDLVQKILGRSGEYPAFFHLYDQLFEIGRTSCFAEIDLEQDCAPINHAAILTTAQLLKDRCTLSLDQIRHILERDLGVYSAHQIDSIIALAAQVMLMADVNIRTLREPSYNLGNYSCPQWLHNQSLVEFITSCFRTVSAEQENNVTRVLKDRDFLTAEVLSNQRGLRFKGTNNIAEHLLLDATNLTLYFFHHAEYIQAHLNLWRDDNSAKTASFEAAIQRGTLCPTLLAETLRSTRSILFRPDDPASLDLLRRLVAEQELDASCLMHQNDGIWADHDEDAPYVYWGKRLIDLHKFRIIVRGDMDSNDGLIGGQRKASPSWSLYPHYGLQSYVVYSLWA